MINVAGEDRRFISAVGANDEPWPEKITEKEIRCRSVVSVHAFGLARRPSTTDIERIFSTARKAGCLTLLDIIAVPGDDLSEALERILPLTDVFIPNDDEGARVTGLDQPLDQALALRELGAQTVVITCGERGLVAASEEGVFSLPAPAVQEIDATGCGDAFSAGFLHAFLDDHDLEGCLKAGSLVGAACVTASGAIGGLPSRDQLTLLEGSHPLAFDKV